jgi:predicted RNase H-like HicB family nuclease
MRNMKRSETINIGTAGYACILRLEPEGGYTVTCPAFPEIVTYGASLHQARNHAHEAIELCLQVYHNEGRPLPPSVTDPRKPTKEVAPVKRRRI